MKLVHIKTRQPVKVGDHVKTFRGDTVIVEGMAEPHKPGSTGRVDVRFEATGDHGTFFPSVIDAEWVHNGTPPGN